MLFVVVFALGCTLLTVRTALTEPTSLQGNVDAVCQYVADSVESYGEKFVQYPLSESCREYQGVGEEAMKKFHRQDRHCYKDIASEMCALQFTDYEASSTCRSTNNFFLKLIKTCKKYDPNATCASYDPTSKTIANPESFCNNSYLKVEQGTSPDGSAAFKMKNFEKAEKMDCKRIAEDYNACVLVAVAQLGKKLQLKVYQLLIRLFHKRITMSQGTPSGSAMKEVFLLIVKIVKDQIYKLMCKNVIIPYIMEMNQKSGNSRTYCNNMYSKYLMFLSTRKADMLLKAKSAKDSLTSLQRNMEMINSFKTTFVDLMQDNLNLETESTMLLNRLRQISIEQAAVDNFVATYFYKLVATTTQAVSNTKNIKYTKLKETTDENLDTFAGIRTSVKSVIKPQKEALEAVRQLRQMIDTGGHVSITQAYGFYPIKESDIEAERERIKHLSEYVQPLAAQYLSAIDTIPQTETGVEMQLRSDGKKYAEDADIYAEQIALLVRYQTSGSQSGNAVTASMSAATHNAEAKAQVAYA